MPRHFHSATDLPAALPLFPLSGVVLLPRGNLPLNVFEPRYLAMVDDALAGDRLIGMIQPSESSDTVLTPRLTGVGAAGRIVGFRETDDNRYLITLSGICRFRLDHEVDAATPYRQGACDFTPFVEDLTEAGESFDFPRDRLMMALKDYLLRRDMKADWKSMINTPAETLVNALAMMCPFEPAEKQALLEASSLGERVSTLVALLEMASPPFGSPTFN